MTSLVNSKSSAILKKNKTIKYLLMNKWLYIMLIPGMLYFLIFKYLPMYGLTIAFKDFQPYLGYSESPWVGIKHFSRLFSEPTFWMLFSNTLILAFQRLIFYFPIPVILALMLNEVGSKAYKRLIQTLTYMPHFMSWVVIVSISYILFTTEGGVINDIIFHLFGVKFDFLVSREWFRPMIVFQTVWREMGWGTIIFLAALTNVDPQLYESAQIDGANRWKQLLHITLPSIRPTIVFMLILRIGRMLDIGFEHVLLMLNPLNREVGEVFDTFVYKVGIQQGQFSYTTAVGFFKSVVCLILVVSSNTLAKKFGEEGIY